MLHWRLAVKPRWTEPGEFNKRVGIFKRYADDALKKTQVTFQEEFYKRVNPSTGTHMKSKRVLALLKTGGEITRTSEDLRWTEVTLEGDSTALAVAYINEFGGTIRPKGAKLLTIPKHLNPALSGKARTFPNTRWAQLSSGPALVTSSPKAPSARKARSPKRARLARSPKVSRTEFKVLYWGKEFVRIKPKHFFRDTSKAVKEVIKETYPRALRRAWDAIWTT